jgi:hypothetical protein
MALNYGSVIIWLKEGGCMVYRIYTIPEAPAVLNPLLQAGAFYQTPLKASLTGGLTLIDTVVICHKEVQKT